MKNISAKYVMGALFMGLCVFAGCEAETGTIPPPADVSSSSVDQQPVNPPDAQSSSSESIPLGDVSSSSVFIDPNLPTSSSDGTLLSSSSKIQAGQELYTFETTPGALLLAPDADGFYDMGDVYKAVPKTSKIAFVIRHSKREKNNTGTQSQLTPIGIQMAQTLGAKLASDEPFYYASTDFVRTRATCENIAIGRGETDVEVVTWDGINGGYFLTVPSDTLDALVSNRGGNQKYIAQYSYGAPYSYANVIGATLSTYFYDLYPRGNQFVNEVIVANISKWKRVSVLVSHDMLVEPLIAFVSNRTIDLKFYQKPFRWVNYLSGIAVIVDEAGAITALPVRGDEVGWMIPSNEVIEEM